MDDICVHNTAQILWEVFRVRSTHFEETDHNGEMQVRIKLAKSAAGNKRPKRKSAKATR